MRDSFTYWYPLDLRVSAKDLVKNHLTMALYNHAFVFQKQELFPKAYFINGYIQVNGKPMSKKLGNFKTVLGICEEYGADASRIAIADCGDTLEDANFLCSLADTTISRLYSFENFIKILVKDNWGVELKIKEVPDFENSIDKVFNNNVNYLIDKIKASYEVMKYREVLKYAFYEMIVIN